MPVPPKIPMEVLRACLQDHYTLFPVTLEFLPVGLDSLAGVYRVVSEQGRAFLLKVTSRPLYEARYLVPRDLYNQGITAVVAPIPTTRGALWTRWEEWTIIVYPFIEGETTWTGMTNEQWEQVGAIFRQIHQAMLPQADCASLRQENFDPTEYIRWIHAFETHSLPDIDETRACASAFRSCWLAHQSRLHTAVTAVETLGSILHKRKLPFVICHADLHPANVLRDAADRVFVLDWDEVMLAPKERDFLFIQESSTAHAMLPGTSAFWKGYGVADIDWIALTYYRYERVVQDVIECAQDVFFRDETEEATTLDALALFQAIIAQGGELEIAEATSVHLPSALTLLSRMYSRSEIADT